MQRPIKPEGMMFEEKTLRLEFLIFLVRLNGSLTSNISYEADQAGFLVPLKPSNKRVPERSMFYF